MGCWKSTQNLEVILKGKLLLIFVALLAVTFPFAIAQPGAGKPFGARDPRTCPSRNAGLTAAQAREYFICDSEVAEVYTGSLYLVTDVTVQVGKGRPFNMQSDSFGWATTNGIDPTQTVYPIRGSFTSWQCSKLGTITGVPGQSCTMTPQPAAQGICFKNSFGDWHCTMMDLGHKGGMERYPPPTGL